MYSCYIINVVPIGICGLSTVPIILLIRNLEYMNLGQ